MSVARLKVELVDVAPRVVRRIEVPLALRLDRLHAVLQAAMPWEDRHLYEFRAGDTRWGLPDPDWDNDTRPAAKATLADLVEHTGTAPIGYLYDFGDSWKHTLSVEDTHDAVPGHLYPRLTDVAGTCPPEDVGGFPGYEAFLDAMADPNHPEYEAMRTWHGRPFEPDIPPADELRLETLKLAKRWKPRNA